MCAARCTINELWTWSGSAITGERRKPVRVSGWFVTDNDDLVSRIARRWLILAITLVMWLMGQWTSSRHGDHERDQSDGMGERLTRLAVARRTCIFHFPHLIWFIYWIVWIDRINENKSYFLLPKFKRAFFSYFVHCQNYKGHSKTKQNRIFEGICELERE